MAKFSLTKNILQTHGLSICTPAQFNQMLDCAKTKEIREALVSLKNESVNAQITEAEYETKKDELKKQLPAITPNAWFRGGHRCAETAVPSGLLLIDIDHMPFSARGWYNTTVSGNEAEEGIVFAAESIRSTEAEGGLHIIKRRNPKLTRKADALDWCKQHGVADYYDQHTHDIARCMYASTRDLVIYYDEEDMFKEEDYQEEAGQQDVLTQVVDKYWENHEEPQDGVAGNRHNELVKLAANLADVLRTNGTYGLEEKEVQQIALWAAKNAGEPSKKMKEILKELESERQPAGEVPIYTSLMQELKPQLPVGFREAIYGQPEYLHLPILAALGPVFGAFADNVSFQYDNGRPQYLMLMTLVIGHPGSGKGSVANIIQRYTVILYDEEQAARAAESRWRMTSNPTTPRPQCLRQLIGSNVTGAAMINLHNNNQGHTLLQVDEELDASRKFKEWSQNDDIYRKSFDRGIASVERSSKESISGMVKAQVNWMFCCTPNQPAELFDLGNSENGLFQRVLPAILPDRTLEPWKKQKRFTAEERKMIENGTKRAVTILRNSKGYYEFDNLIDACEEWAESKRQLLIKGNDKLKGLIQRPTQILMRYAMLWWLLSGENEPDEQAIKFGTMMAEYMLAGQIALLDANIAKQTKVALPKLGKTSTTQNVYDQLPQHFTLADYQTISPATSKESQKRNIRRWKSYGWITETSNTYTKVTA